MIDVSVVIPTWNNSRRLAVTLDAMASCRIPAGLRWEVIVVANNCADETATVAAGFEERLPLSYVEEPSQGASRARNAGIAAARGELVIFADDDVRPCREWIVAYWRAHREMGGGGYLVGPLQSEFEAPERVDPDLLSSTRMLSVLGFDHGPTRRRLVPGERFGGANWACPATALRDAGGFDPTIGLDASRGRRRAGEEVVLRYRLERLGVPGLYVPDARVVHFVPHAKCSLAHAGQNWRAHGLLTMQVDLPNPYLKGSPWLQAWLGEERWTVRAGARACLATAVAATRCVIARSFGRKGYGEYLRLQFCLGRLEGYAEWLRGRLGEVRQ